MTLRPRNPPLPPSPEPEPPPDPPPPPRSPRPEPRRPPNSVGPPLDAEIAGGTALVRREGSRDIPEGFLPLHGSRQGEAGVYRACHPTISMRRAPADRSRWQRVTEGQEACEPLSPSRRSRFVPGPGTGVSGPDPAGRAAAIAEARLIARNCASVSSPSRCIRSSSSAANPPSGPLVSRRRARRSQCAISQATIATPAKKPSHGSVSEASDSAAGAVAIARLAGRELPSPRSTITCPVAS